MDRRQLLLEEIEAVKFAKDNYRNKITESRNNGEVINELEVSKVEEQLESAKMFMQNLLSMPEMDDSEEVLDQKLLSLEKEMAVLYTRFLHLKTIRDLESLKKLSDDAKEEIS